MPGYRTEGIVLKRLDVGEADRILTILTRHRGKISVIAKGVRRMTSRKGGNVELLNWIRMFCAEGRNIDLLTEVETKHSFQKLKDNLILSGYAYHIIEILDRLLPENDPNPAVLTLTTDVLSELTRAPRKIIVRAFEIKLLNLLGFWAPSELGIDDKEVSSIAEELQKKDWTSIRDLGLTEQQSNVLETTLRTYLEKTMESPLRSVRLLQKIKMA